MKHTTVSIILASSDHEVLDNSARAVLNKVNPNELDEITVAVLPVEEGLQRRKITLTNPTDKNIWILTHVDIPNNVSISVVNN